MPRAKRPLQDADANAGPRRSDATTKSGTKKRKSVESATSQKSDVELDQTESNEPNVQVSDPSDWKFIARCQPGTDKQRARYAKKKEEKAAGKTDEASDDHDENSNEDKELTGLGTCICGKPYVEQHAEHPDWVWYMTEEGQDHYSKWGKATFTRNPDAFGMYIYNDFNAYGMIEIQENMLVALNEEMKKRKNRSIPKIWAVIEAASYWLTNSENMAWLGADDGEGVEELVGLWGIAFLNVIKILIDEGLFRTGPDAPVKNLSLVLGLMVLHASTWSEMIGTEGNDTELTWVCSIIELAEKHGVTISGPSGLEAELKEFKENGKRSDMEVGTEAFWKKSLWSTKFNSYRKRHAKGYGGRDGIGGDAYDIAAMTPAERKRYAFDKKDPLKKEMIPPKEGVLCTF